MPQTNVRVRPNVICRSLQSMDGTETTISLRAEQIATRIAYWELLEFVRACPLQFSGGLHRKERLSTRQKVELEKYLDPGPRVGHLWPGNFYEYFEPFPATFVEDPFFTPKNDCISEFVIPGIPPVSHILTAEALVVTPQTNQLIANQQPDEVIYEIQHTRVADDEQEIVIKAPSTSNQIVLAPPGTGKTYILIKRLRELVERGDIGSPASEILVLSFSRAAVAEIARRLAAEVETGAQDDLRYVQVRTFDSYATRMLVRGETTDIHLAFGYEKRIAQFCKNLKAGILPEAAKEEISCLQHLIVDEVQDLNGDRARMTLQMIEHVIDQGGTVLLLGDPAQAIYDWQLADGDTATSAEFLNKARLSIQDASCTSNFNEVQLCNYRRFQNRNLLDFVKSCRASLGHDGKLPDVASLTNQLQRLPAVPFSYLQDIQDSHETTAILTRTNLEAFQISNWCRAQGLAHQVERGISGRYWPGWIARLCQGYRMGKMSLDTARKRWTELIAANEWLVFDDAHEYLQRHGLFSDDLLDMNSLAELIEKSQPQCSWPPDSAGSLVISTIHRSKGLEYDRVIMLKTLQGNLSAGDLDEKDGEARLIYVAATRAKRNLMMLMRDHSVLKRGNKFCKRYSFSKLNHFHLFEDKKNYLLLDGLDEFNVEALFKTATHESMLEIQKSIWQTCNGGASRLTAERDSGELYWTLPGGKRFCALSRELNASLVTLGKTYRGGDRDAVTQLCDVPVVDVASISCAWQANKSVDSCLGTAKLALMPVVYGLSTVVLAT